MGFYHMVHPHLAHRRLRKPGDPVPFLTLANLYSCRPMQLQSLRAHCTFHASWSFEFLAASSHSEKSNADGFYVFHCFYIMIFKPFRSFLKVQKAQRLSHRILNVLCKSCLENLLHTAVPWSIVANQPSLFLHGHKDSFISAVVPKKKGGKTCGTELQSRYMCLKAYRKMCSALWKWPSCGKTIRWTVGQWILPHHLPSGLLRNGQRILWKHAR